MGQWKSKPVPHEHDMPGPDGLALEGALKGWVWACSCAVEFELCEYRLKTDTLPPYSKWKNVSNGQFEEVV